MSAPIKRSRDEAIGQKLADIKARVQKVNSKSKKLRQKEIKFGEQIRRS